MSVASEEYGNMELRHHVASDDSDGTGIPLYSVKSGRARMRTID